MTFTLADSVAKRIPHDKGIIQVTVSYAPPLSRESERGLAGYCAHRPERCRQLSLEKGGSICLTQGTNHPGERASPSMPAVKQTVVERWAGFEPATLPFEAECSESTELPAHYSWLRNRTAFCAMTPIYQAR